MDRLKPNMFRDQDEFSRARCIKFSHWFDRWIDEVLIEGRPESQEPSLGGFPFQQPPG